MTRKILIVLLAVSLIGLNCTKLEEKFGGDLSASQVTGGSSSASALLLGTYNSMRTTFQDQTRVYCLWEMTTDELIGPTRGPDWDDNGVWRVLHEHKWDGENIRLREGFNDLLGTTYAATNLLQFSPTPQQAAEARFLRAFAQFMVLDGWDQVPYRDPGESVLEPSRVRKGSEALDFIMTELTAIMNDLPNGGGANKPRANKDAARVLLMKCYLNKGVFASNATRNAPTFAAADMNQVIALADQVINTGNYSFASNYFDNFAPANTTIGSENIWTQENVSGVGTGSPTVRSRYHSAMHYKQKPEGWNGFTTLSDFYNKFEPADKRRGVAYNTPAGALPNPGNRVNVGILTGQQYDWAVDTALKDRTGAPLAFTPNVKSIEVGTNLEVTGYRAYKYAIDYPNAGSGNTDNDYVFFRLADVLLMKAEAILRGGTGTVAGTYGSTALALVNSIRTNAGRGASALASVSLDQLLDERSRELYLESWRRQDLVRFGKFLLPWQEKAASDPKYLLFAIPNEQLAVNPNLTPNPGY
ncbi:MAG: RagB/SusD family nutrient uptake outer membrane protein [Chitinophagaceae bacterium]|nr:RagB/SusD family nutrient uptake outer membrane protein [Chitinophagaceae bacterium]